MKLYAIQGDVMIFCDSILPKEAKKKKDKVLVYGEATGHAHRLSDGEIYEYQDRMLFTAPIGSIIEHEEHDPVTIELPGIYEIKRQKEYKNKDMTALVID